MGNIPIEEISIGHRRRESMGDIDALASSIAHHGLLHPVVLDASNALIAGHRRLEACRSLGWDKIPFRSAGNITPEQMRELELRENLDRKDFTEYELSKNMAALVETVKQRLEKDFRPSLGQKPPPHRKSDPGSLRSISQDTGIPRQTIHDSLSHVKAVEAYPVLEPLPKTTAIHIARKATDIPEPRRAEYVEAMAASERQFERECRQIDSDAKISVEISKAIMAINCVKITPAALDTWVRFSNMGGEEIRQQITYVDDAVRKLGEIRNFLKNSLGLRIVKGG